jgi:hypothetical protein
VWHAREGEQNTGPLTSELGASGFFILKVKNSTNLLRFIKRIHRLALAPVLYLFSIGRSYAELQSFVGNAEREVVADRVGESLEVVTVRLAHRFAQRVIGLRLARVRGNLRSVGFPCRSFADDGRAMPVIAARAMGSISYGRAVAEMDGV